MVRLSFIARRMLPVVYFLGACSMLGWYFTSDRTLLSCAVLVIAFFWCERYWVKLLDTINVPNFLKFDIVASVLAFAIASLLFTDGDAGNHLIAIALIVLTVIFLLFHAKRFAEAFDEKGWRGFFAGICMLLVALPLIVTGFSSLYHDAGFACTLFVLYGDLLEVYGRKFCAMCFSNIPDTAL